MRIFVLVGGLGDLLILLLAGPPDVVFVVQLLSLKSLLLLSGGKNGIPDFALTHGCELVFAWVAIYKQ
jgi:hypothetical protein